LNEELPLPVIPEKKGKTRRIEIGGLNNENSAAATTTPAPIRLTDEQVKEKYAENEEYQDWSRRLSRFRLDMERILKKGLPRIYQYDDELAEVVQDHLRFSKLRD
jgi:hypothetical protein